MFLKNFMIKLFELEFVRNIKVRIWVYSQQTDYKTI